MKSLKYALLVPVIWLLLAFQTIPGYTGAQIEQFVREVFGTHADALVLKSSSDRKAIIENFLSRVKFVHAAGYAQKKFENLSRIELQNKYNSGIRRDSVFDPASFNPLKYRFAMHSPHKQIYRIDGTQWLIIINPIK